MSAIVIEQTQDEAKLAFALHQNTAIHRIRLARANVHSQAIDELIDAPISVAFQFEAKQIDAPPDTLRLEIAFRMSGVAEDVNSSKPALEQPKKPADPLVQVECAYEVDYAVRESFTASPDHVAAFKDGNAIFNTWPYFREFLQSSLQRMGYPPLTAPFLRLQPKAATRDQRKRIAPGKTVT